MKLQLFIMEKQECRDGLVNLLIWGEEASFDDPDELLSLIDLMIREAVEDTT